MKLFIHFYKLIIVACHMFTGKSISEALRRAKTPEEKAKENWKFKKEKHALYKAVKDSEKDESKFEYLLEAYRYKMDEFTTSQQEVMTAKIRAFIHEKIELHMLLLHVVDEEYFTSTGDERKKNKEKYFKEREKINSSIHYFKKQLLKIA